MIGKHLVKIFRQIVKILFTLDFNSNFSYRFFSPVNRTDNTFLS